LNSPSIAEDLSRIAARDPDRIAVIVGERQVSFAELDGLVERLAAGLREQGVQRGDRVAIMLPNGIDAVVAIEGTLRAGAAIMPINPTAKHDRVSDLLGRSEAAALLCDEERAGEVSVAVAAVDGVSWFSDLEQLSSDATVPRETPDDADLAALMHTSGSTGGPKGVMHCHGGLGFVTDSIIEYLEVTPEDRILNLLPLSFGYGLTHLLICMRSGATLVARARRRARPDRAAHALG